MRIKTAATILLGPFAALTVSILTSALAHADEGFIMCPSGHDGVATEVTSCAFADNVRRAWLDQYGPVARAALRRGAGGRPRRSPASGWPLQVRRAALPLKRVGKSQTRKVS
jgi:hypothetical protein